MPRSSRLASYGPEYPALLTTAYHYVVGAHCVTLPDNKAALALQRKLYAYFSALRSDSNIVHLARMADAITLRVEANVLTLYRNENSWDAIAIRESLGLEKGFAGESNITMAPSDTTEPLAIFAESAAERLAKIRANRQ